MKFVVMINGFGERCSVPVSDEFEHDLEGTCECCPVFDADIIYHSAVEKHEEQ